MGTEIIETRFPVLNILDAIWINAEPRAGPDTSYQEATKTSIIAASTDPVALDCWGAKNILIPAARAAGYEDISSMDPDEASAGSFGSWLRLSMLEIEKAGYQATMDDNRMNIYISSNAP
jgi:hypothetical protein